MIEELKQVRDALVKITKTPRHEYRLSGQNYNFYPSEEVDFLSNQAIATLDRISAPVGVPDGYKMVPMSLIEQRLAVAYGRGKGANRTYRPKIGERCLVSPPNCDDDNGYIFQEYNILWSNDIFVLYGNDGYYPNMDKWEHIIAKPLSAAPTPAPTEIDLDYYSGV